MTAKEPYLQKLHPLEREVSQVWTVSDKPNCE